MFTQRLLQPPLSRRWRLNSEQSTALRVEEPFCGFSPGVRLPRWTLCQRSGLPFYACRRGFNSRTGSARLDTCSSLLGGGSYSEHCSGPTEGGPLGIDLDLGLRVSSDSSLVFPAAAELPPKGRGQEGRRQRGQNKGPSASAATHRRCLLLLLLPLRWTVLVCRAPKHHFFLPCLGKVQNVVNPTLSKGLSVFWDSQSSPVR